VLERQPEGCRGWVDDQGVDPLGTDGIRGVSQHHGRVLAEALEDEAQRPHALKAAPWGADAEGLKEPAAARWYAEAQSLFR